MWHATFWVAAVLADSSCVHYLRGSYHYNCFLKCLCTNCSRRTTDNSFGTLNSEAVAASATTMAFDEQDGADLGDELAAVAAAAASAAAAAFGEWAAVAAGTHAAGLAMADVTAATGSSSAAATPLSYAHPTPQPPPRRPQPQPQHLSPLWRSASDAIPLPKRWSSPDATLQELIAPTHMAAVAELGGAAGAWPAPPWPPHLPPRSAHPVESSAAAAAATAAAFIHTTAGDCYPPPLPFDGTFIASDLPLGSAGFVVGPGGVPTSPGGRRAGGQCFLSATGGGRGGSSHQRMRGGGGGGSGSTVSMASSYTSGGAGLQHWGGGGNAHPPPEEEEEGEEEVNEEEEERLMQTDGALAAVAPQSTSLAAPECEEGSKASVFSKVLGRVI